MDVNLGEYQIFFLTMLKAKLFLYNSEKVLNWKGRKVFC